MQQSHGNDWSPPSPWTGAHLPPEVHEWLEAKSSVVLSTLQPDGQPQLSVVWAAVEDGHLVMATVKGRQKHVNLEHDSRATVLITPLGDHDHYVEIRGTIEINLRGGRELIDNLHEIYRGTRPYPWDKDGDMRVTLKLLPQKVVIFHG